MGNVLKCDASSADAYLVKDGITWPGGGWYAEYKVAFPSATLTSLASLPSGSVFAAAYWQVFDGTGGSGTTSIYNSIGDPPTYSAAGVTSPAEMYAVGTNTKTQTSLFAANLWHTVQIHFDGTNFNYTIDGTPYAGLTDTPFSTFDSLVVGGRFASHVPNEIYYMDDIKIGTTLGGTDIFADDFESGLSGWDAVVGAATVVADPFPAGPTGPTGSTGPPPTTGYAPTFTVTNLDHDGSEISTFTPIAGTLRWTYRLAQSGGPGEGAWAIALSDESIVTADQFAPFRTDWKITMHYPDEPDEDLIAGILGPINTGSEASGVFGQVSCSGKDWLHWLEQPYPFGYADVVADVVNNQLLDPANLFKQWIGQSQVTIVSDLITALDGNVGAVIFTASYEGTGWALTLDKEVAFGDNTTLLDLILNIAKLATFGLDQYGFDMWVDPDKTVHFVAPRVTDPSSVTPIFTLDDANIVAPPLDWTNNGPIETDSVVFGQANNNTSRIGFADYAPSQTVYRQWTQFAQVSLAQGDAIAAAAQGIGQQDRFPQKNLKITIRPDLLDPLDPRVGFRSQLGQGILVHYPISPYHTIFADFYIVEQAYYSPDGCNWLCDLTLQQIYTADANPDTS